MSDNWARGLARRVEPAEVDGNMGPRARLWRALGDWAWGIDLGTPYRRRLLWVWRRLT